MSTALMLNKQLLVPTKYKGILIHGQTQMVLHNNNKKSLETAV